MKEILNFHIGQAGVQLGSAMWELFCAEHKIDEDGKIKTEQNNTSTEFIESYFSRSTSEKFVPRGLFIDLEPNVVDELKSSCFRNLFHPDRLIRSHEDAASNFARGFFTVGKLVLGRICTEIRKLFEACNSVHGLIIYRSLGGGTGAGLTSAIFDVLADYAKTPKVEVPIYPSPQYCSSPVEPYNAVLAQHFCIEDIDLSLVFDNEALYSICNRYLYNQSPTFSIINRLISQVIASVTAPIRFENSLNADMTLLQVNLVPYPRIHFPICNFAPVAGYLTQPNEDLSTEQMTMTVFEPENQLVKVDVTCGRYMSCGLFYRGTVSPYSVYRSLSSVKRNKRIDFVEWCPTGFKIGINNSYPVRIPESYLAPTEKNVTMLTSSSAIGQIFQRICDKFMLLYQKDCFLHWFYGESMEEREFVEAISNIKMLSKDYEEVTEESQACDGIETVDNDEGKTKLLTTETGSGEKSKSSTGIKSNETKSKSSSGQKSHESGTNKSVTKTVDTKTGDTKTAPSAETSEKEPKQSESKAKSSSEKMDTTGNTSSRTEESTF